MKKNKLKRYAEVKSLPNIIEVELLNSETETLTHHWDNYFNNSNEVILELGCGKGEYTVALAEENKNKNYIGIDIKGARIWSGAKQALLKELHNVLFLRMYIDHIDTFFPKNSISEIWITFPDPYPKHRSKFIEKRLTSEVFLEKYQKIIKSTAKIHLKTDSALLYNFTLDSVKNKGGIIHVADDNIYDNSQESAVTAIQTRFEKKFLEQKIPIKYICFSI